MSYNMDNLMDCSKVYLKSMPGKGASTFARVAIKEGEMVEFGIMRRLPKSFNGNECEYVFCWSDDIPNTTWTFSSGCAAFYNTSLTPNTKMTRIYDEDRFEIHATKDIEAEEELTHRYKSLEWRECWDDLREKLGTKTNEEK